QYGCGILARYEAYKWQDGGLTGVSRPDPVTLSDLVSYEQVRKDIISNTEQFLHGYPANNMLLYGDRGTGKSSTVKALLHAYSAQGLRLVELSKQALTNFPQLMSQLRERNHYFIIFIDDLSFEENETQYKDFKALLEGGLEARPQNMLVYATSNRRHLVRETFADRTTGTAGDEVRAMDSVQEKLSLADRFGITVIFPSPNQELFLEIVSGLAQQRGLTVAAAELRQRALHWSSWHNGRSPRAARQFIDQLQGELAMAKT
ncbi:MAG: ATP-binding protein, partial [Firmicutes bacterium]|nr:ATP-binding protein [Bacillota bacterium]